MFQSIGLSEWMIIGLIVVLVFGGKKVPELFKGLGESVREFKKAAKGSEQKES